MTSENPYEATRHGRWPRFSLRLLLVMVAVLSCVGVWVRYQLDWIEQRHEVLKSELLCRKLTYV